MARAVSTTGSWFQYSSWIKNIARNLRPDRGPNALTPTIRTAMKTFIIVFWDVQNKTTCTRPWLKDKMCRASLRGADNYNGDARTESTAALLKMVEIIGRDLKKVPLSPTEKTACDTFIAATGTYRLGNKVTFGSVVGTVKTTPSGIVS